MITTLTTTAATALISAGINLSETFPGGLNIVPDTAPLQAAAIEVTPEVVEPKVDGRNKAARAHNLEARLARRSDAKRKGGAGMTKTERLALAAQLRAEGKNPSDARTWNAATKAARGL